VNGAADLASKVVGVLAAILGTAGYVLVLGAAIMWLRLQQVDLPPEVPVSLASREELIAIGAQAVAVWVLLVAALGGLTAWIISGNPDRRRFGYVEAGLAVSVTISTLSALSSDEGWMFVLPSLAILVIVAGALVFWPSVESVVAVVLPTAIGIGLAVALSLLHERNATATVIGATSIFGALVLLAPGLQRWRMRQEANRNALAQLEVLAQPEAKKSDVVDGKNPIDALRAALQHGRVQSPAIAWIGRIAVGAAILVALGVIAVASQLDHDEDFHAALVSLTNGDCIKGTYVARGVDQIVLADAYRTDVDEKVRLTTIPVKEVLEVQVYGKPSEGLNLKRTQKCSGVNDAMIHPTSAPSAENGSGGTEAG
jgi:hypothetical protein